MTHRRFLVFFDGTWNTPDSGNNPTNVVKFLRAVKTQSNDVSQICFYDKGVGTGGPIDRFVGGLTGKGLNDNMIDGYRFLANNADENDEVYIFGFSRGAYTARSLVGLIGLAGLLSPLNLGHDLLDVIEIYRNNSLNLNQKKDKVCELDLKGRKDVRISCVGVWDTVGSLGIPGDIFKSNLSEKYYFQDVQLSDKVDVALHAVAIDEKRAAFSPTLWVRDKHKEVNSEQVVEQVWFSGVHSNVGGSYEDAGLSDVALDWMIKRIKKHTDLSFDDAILKDRVHPNHLADGIESRTLLYIDSKIFPYQRLISQRISEGTGFGEWIRKTFQKIDRRNIPPNGLVPINEMIHISAKERFGENVVHDSRPQTEYRPKTLEIALKCLPDKKDVPVVDWDGEIT